MRVLVIAAHPDDTEFICGGTIAAMTSNGDHVSYVIVTSGELGLTSGERDPFRREHEQSAAASALGVTSVEFLREPDGHVSNTPALRAKLVKAIRTSRPDLVISHSPVYHLGSVRYSHLDHLAVGQAALAAVFPESRNGRFYPSDLEAGLKPWTVPKLWLCGVDRPNHSIDISVHFEAKIRAAKLHESQQRHFTDVYGFFRDWASEVAQRHGMPLGVLAEEFHTIST